MLLRFAGEALVRGALLRLPDFDAHLAAAISGRSPAATELAVHLLKAAVQDAKPPLAGPDLPASVDVSLVHIFVAIQCADTAVACYEGCIGGRPVMLVCVADNQLQLSHNAACQVALLGWVAHVLHGHCF